MSKSDDTVTLESFDSLTSYWLKSKSLLMWNCIFVLPPWLEVWWHDFGSEAELYLGAIRKDGTIAGIAPLLLRGTEASFIGSTDLCDYLDFVIVPGKEVGFFNILLDDLHGRGIRRLNLGPLRPNSSVLTYLVSIAKNRNYDVSRKVEDVSLELDLPPTWQEYLNTLTQKQRHEVNRKLRRLGEAGDVNYRVVEDNDSLLDSMDLFLRLFRQSREDKAIFLTNQIESFFRSLVKATARSGLLRFGILELNASPAAVVMYFDYNNSVFLYNNGYDPKHSFLSVGLISKVLCLKDSVERGRSKFDFLKGAEEYKYRLGGKEISLYRCEISFK
jgi:CelD/BcsL family acetyltransferase involved in cellulose biosynthesis